MGLDQGEELVIAIQSNLVAERVPALRTRLLEAVAAEQLIVLDLEGVTMIDSAGLGLLISTQNSLERSRRRLTLRHVPEKIAEMMRIMRLDRHFSIES